MALFTGTTVMRIDRKGRVSVPASFRAALKSQPFEGIAVYPDFDQPCLVGYTNERLERMADAIDSPDLLPNRTHPAHDIFSRIRQLPFDPEGRVVLPEDMARHLGIGEFVAFVGRGRFFELWEPNRIGAPAAPARDRSGP